MSDTLEQTIIDILDNHHDWFMNIIKDEFKEVIDGYYNTLMIDLWRQVGFPEFTYDNDAMLLSLRKFHDSSDEV